MASAKVTFAIQDRSTIVAALDGIYSGVVVVTDKGVEEPTLVTTTDQFIDRFGEPNPKLGVSVYSALNYLTSGNKLWVTRAISDNARYSAALVRTKTVPVDTTDAFATWTDESLIIKPIENGLTRAELDSYVFPLYHTNKEYASVLAELTNSPKETDQIPVDTTKEFKVGDFVSLSSHTLAELNSKDDTVGEDTATYKVIEIGTRIDKIDKLRLSSPVSVRIGDQIVQLKEVQKTYQIGEDDPDNPGTPLQQPKTKTETEAVPFHNDPVVVKTATNSREILVTSGDYIHPGMKLQIGTNNPQETTFIDKDLYEDEVHYLKIDQRIDVDESLKVYRLIQAEFEERDAFLVTYYSRGFDGNNVSIGVTPSKNYEEAFNILVYYKGVLKETFEVTRDYFLDGFSRQMYLEDKINGKSKYIMVKNNINCVDIDGNLKMPLYTDHSYWRQDPEDVFNATDIYLRENLLLNHKEVLLSDVSTLSLGNRIRFIMDDLGTMSKEYKIIAKDDVNNTIKLDRPLEENKIPQVFNSSDGKTTYKTELYKFDGTLNSPEFHIRKGIRYFPIKRLEKVFYNYPINSKFIISGMIGTLLDPGCNLLTGGTLGDPVTVADLIKALNKMCNNEETPITLLMDGGYATVTYAQALLALTEKQDMCHLFLSNSIDAEESADPLKATLDYRNSLNINNRNASLFSGWIKKYDYFNKRYIWTSPESYGVVAQSFTTKNYSFFTPAAGYTRGVVSGEDVRVHWNEPERDILVEHQINPIRYKIGEGLMIWGNETLLVKPSPLQLRSVNMLLIAIKFGFKKFLEYHTFNFNNEKEWKIVEGALDAFMRDDIKAKEGVYDYKIAVKDIITHSDIDNRRMPVYLGIQPTMDIQTIDVTMAIYNSGLDISVG